MPKLKKFRVVNLIYNDTRHIYDETFDFNDGDHGMMLLANGGGKTVLTQMMMQPVIPKTDLKTRKFADYFKHNKRPTLLLSEWLLDDGSSSLLTGLVIKNRVRKKRGQDENLETLDIYGFIIQYHYNESYKIDTLPLTYRDETGRKSMRSYIEIVTDLKKHAQKYEGFTSVFNWSDSREAKSQYSKKLAEYGIVQQEWKDNILKINKEEAGLKSFFEDAKTSETLLKRKILPTIESKLDEKATDKVEIQALFKTHAKEEVKNKKIIEDEKLYHQFLKDSQDFEHKVYNYDLAEQDADKCRAFIGQMFLGLRNAKKKTSSDIEASEDAKRSNRKMMERIKFEEECFKYYKHKIKYDRLSESYKQLEETYNLLEEKLTNSQYEEKVLLAAKYHSLVMEVNSYIEVKREELELKKKEKNSEEYEVLNQVLALKYEELEQKLRTELEIFLEKIEAVTIRDEAIDEEKYVLEGNKRTQEDIVAVANSRTDVFLKLVKSVNKDTFDYKDNDGFQWKKHILYNDYEISILQEHAGKLNAKRESFDHKKLELQSVFNEKGESIQTLTNQLQNNRVEKSVITKDLDLAKNEYNRYLQVELELFEQLRVLQIEESELFDEDYVYSQLDEIIYGKEERFNHLTIERAMTEQLLQSLRDGQLISLLEEVETFLLDNQIEFRYGYEWLLSHKGDVIPRDLYMKKINVLPYALIMDDGNYKTFMKLTKAYHMNMILPVINENYISRLMEGEIIDLEDEGLSFHTAFEEALLDPSHVSREIDVLSVKIKKVHEEQETLADSRNAYQNLKLEYRKFLGSYRKESNKLLKVAIVLKEELLINIEKETNAGKKEIDILLQERKHINESILSLEKSLGELSGLLDECEKLEKEFEIYNREKTLRSKAKEKIKLIEKDIIRLGEEAKVLKQEKYEIKDKIKNHNQSIVDCEKKGLTLQKKLPDQQIKGYKLYESDVETLAIRFDVYNRELGDIKQIEEAMASLMREKKMYESNLNTVGLNELDYIEKVYSDELYTSAAKRLKELKNEHTKYKEELIGRESVLKEKISNLDEEKDEILSKPNRDVLVNESELTHTDFRLRKNENQSEYKKWDKTLVEQKQLKMEIESALDELQENMITSVLEDDMKPYMFGEGITRVEIQTERRKILRQLNLAIKKTETDKQEVLGNYQILKSTYNGNNDLFSNMFNHLLKVDSIFDYDFVQRVLKQSAESINRTLEKYQADIRTLRNKEEVLYSFVMTKVSNVYDELKDMDKHSIIDLNQKRQKMLYIQLPKKENIDQSRLLHYMQDVIRVAKHKIESGEFSDLDKYLDNHLKLEQLFDEYISIGSIGVDISKIEQNKVSKMTWEKVGKASGGELFVSVFIVFSSLLSYTRGYQLSKGQQGKVLVMDNPFGPVSSEHLLEPLFKIAKTYDTQMICFTHINTSAITNQFDLIYSLRVIQEGGSNREHIHVELSKDKNKEIEYIDTGKFEIGVDDQIGFL